MKKRRYTLSKVVEVEWVDANSRGDWRMKEGYLADDPLAHCRSVGYLLRKDRRVVELAQSADTFGKVNDAISIPRSTITSFRVLPRNKR